MTTFIVEGVPAPQGSKKAFVRGGRAVLVEASAKVKPWRDAVAVQAKRHFPTPLDGPVYVAVQFVMPRPKAWGRKRMDPMVQTPDADKLLRAVNDALTGIAYRDDSQIVHLVGRKRRAVHGETPGAVITVRAEQ